jgi:hypothetical protein
MPQLVVVGYLPAHKKNIGPSEERSKKHGARGDVQEDRE